MTGLPLTPRALASSHAFANGSWRDGYGRSLFAALAYEIGEKEARTLWIDAAKLFDAAHPQVIGDPDGAW